MPHIRYNTYRNTRFHHKPITRSNSPIETVKSPFQLSLYRAGNVVSADEPLMAAGLDSLGSVEFVNVLSRHLQLSLPATLIFDHPTATAVAQHIHSQLLHMAVSTSATATDSAIDTETTYLSPAPLAGTLPVGEFQNSRVVAVLATAQQRLQLSALSSLGSLNTGVVSRSDAISSIPIRRWEIEDSGMFGSRFGAFMEGVELFDAAAFGLSVAEATLADPQHRLLLSLTGEYNHAIYESF